MGRLNWTFDPTNRERSGLKMSIVEMNECSFPERNEENGVVLNEGLSA